MTDEDVQTVLPIGNTAVEQPLAETARKNPLIEIADCPVDQLVNMETLKTALDNATVEDAVDAIRYLLRLGDNTDELGYVLSIALRNVQDLLPESSRIYHVAFVGAKGSGKTTATGLTALFLKNGMHIEGVTYPALASCFDDGMALCIDEIDAQSERCPDLIPMLRSAICLNGTYRKMVQNEGGGHHRDSLKVGGMCFVNWLDEAQMNQPLKQRCMLVEMAEYVDATIVVRNEAPSRYAVPIRMWFENQADRVREQWPKEKVADLVGDRDGSIVREIEEMDVPVARRMQMAFWMIVATRMYGWKLGALVKNLVSKQPEDDFYDNYKALLKVIWQDVFTSQGKDGVVKIPVETLKGRLNQAIDDNRLERLKPRKGSFTWVGLEKECHLTTDLGYKKRIQTDEGNIWHYVFDKPVLKRLGVGGEGFEPKTVAEWM